jgi:hypothetical protein
MPDLHKKFSKAVEKISSENKDIRAGVYCAYVDHLSDIDPDDLPREIQMFYESVKTRLTSTIPPGKMSFDEAGWIAEDILFMADVIKIHYRP